LEISLEQERAVPDRYKDFRTLSGKETEGVDYRICVVERTSPAAIVAPHGGRIEPGTSEIAAAIAGDVHSLYCFEGLGRRAHGELHIASERFDEPRCLALIGRCDIVVSVHGLGRDDEALEVGGLDTALRDLVRERVQAVGFRGEIAAPGRNAGVSPRNVCNRGRNGKGVQLELSKGLRAVLLTDRQASTAFATAVRQALSSL
jgi:phage replication-related protein YjqB (UPF0714/DUF867 family)